MEGVIRHENEDVAAMQFRRWFDQTVHLTESRDGMRKPVRWMAALWSIDGFGTIKVQRTCWDFPMGVARREAVDLLMRDLAKDDVGGMLPSDPLPLAPIQATLEDVVGSAMRGDSVHFGIPGNEIPVVPSRSIEDSMGCDCIDQQRPSRIEEEEEEEDFEDDLDEEEDDWEEVDDEDLDDEDDDFDDDEDEEEDWD